MVCFIFVCVLEGSNNKDCQCCLLLILRISKVLFDCEDLCFCIRMVYWCCVYDALYDSDLSSVFCMNCKSFNCVLDMKVTKAWYVGLA